MQRIWPTADGLFHNGDASTGTLGTVCSAEWLNSVQEEICQVIEEVGFTLNPGSYLQLLQAVQELIDIAALVLATSSETIAGLRNDLAVTPAGLAALTGSESRSGLLRTATGAQTIAGDRADLAVSPLGLAALQGGEVVTGLWRGATAAETATGTARNLAVTPFGLLSLFSKTDFSSSPYLRIPDRPGGFIIQWGIAASVATDATSPYIAFPVTFPNAVFVILPGHILSSSSSGPGAPCSVKSDYTTSNFRLIQDTEGPSSGEFWIAIGN